MGEMHERVDGHGRITSPEGAHQPALQRIIAEGRTAEVFDWDEGYVLKLFRTGWERAAVEHEAEIARVLYTAGAPSPAVGAVIEVAGRWGIIYERIAGPSLLGVVAQRPRRLRWAARRLADVHVAMHAQTLTELPALRDVLERALRHADPLPHTHRDSALRALDRLPDGNVLCHGDFHPDNVLLSPRGPLVIDWQNAACGVPAADVARTLLLLRMAWRHMEGSGPARRLAIRMALAAATRAYLRRYRQLAPLARQDLAAWALPVTAARLSEGIPEEEPHLLRLVARLAADTRSVTI